MAEYHVYRELTWKCPNCDTTQKGGDVNCSGCGQARENVEFSDKGSSVVTDQAKLAVAKGGADWICSYCKTSNRNGAVSCNQCGGSKKEGKSRSSSPKRDHVPRQTFHEERPFAERVAETVGPYTESVAPVAAAAGGFAALAGAVATGAFFFWLLWFLFFETHNVHLVLKQVAWQRTISLQHYVPVQHEGWDAPAGSTIISSWRALHHTDKVQSGTKTVQVPKKVKSGSHKEFVRTDHLQNGFARDVYRDVDDYKTIYVNKEEPVYRNVPVYRTRYKYSVMEWCTGRSVPTQGNDVKPYWGEVVFAPNEREGSRWDQYEGVFEEVVEKKVYKKSFESAEFVQLIPGGLYEADVTRAGSMSNLKKLAE